MRIAILGADGQLGQALVRTLSDFAIAPLSRRECDITNYASVRDAFAAFQPSLVINAAAYTDVNRAELDVAGAFAVNALGSRWVSAAAGKHGARVIGISTDYVFAGDGGAPYHEWAPTNPASVYGQSKRAGEIETLSANSRAAVVRTSWLYGGGGRTFVNAILAAAISRPRLDVVADEVGGPTLVDDLARSLRELALGDGVGMFHLANEGECSRHEFATAILKIRGIDTPVDSTTQATYAERFPGQAPRPAHSTLSNSAAASLGIRLRHWHDALHEHLCAQP